MTERQVIMVDGEPAFVVVPIEEWRRIEEALEDRIDISAVRAFRNSPTETFPSQVVDAILRGGHPLKVFREFRGMSQSQLAKAAKTSTVYISQIETGRRRAGRRLLRKLGSALKVDWDLLEAAQE